MINHWIPSELIFAREREGDFRDHSLEGQDTRGEEAMPRTHANGFSTSVLQPLCWTALLLAMFFISACGDNRDGDPLADATLPDGVVLPDGIDLDGLELPQNDTKSEFGDFGEPCESNDDCESGICVPGPLGQNVCSQGCEEECPPGWLCTELAGEGDKTMFACIPGLVNHCAICEDDVECGGKVDRCTPLGEEGLSYCTQHCEIDEECPDGYYCTLPGAGVGSQQCSPISGECACPPEIDGTKRPCHVANTDGVCYGTELCNGPWGWTGCTAGSPTPELCDNEDNNCNGDVDEGLSTDIPCTLQNELGTCQGVVSCENGQELCTAGNPFPETCDGIDNDCNGETDEGVSQACKNPCGQPGNSVCVNGVFGTCDAPTPPEICDDGTDNDCDQVIDEEDCLKGLAEPGASVAFFTSEYYPTNVVTDHGDGTYSQAFFGLADPNALGTAWAKVNLTIQPDSFPWFVSAESPTTIQLAASANDLYDDRRDTVLMVAVRDDRYRPAAQGTNVNFDLDGGLGLDPITCSTDALGRCSILLTLPDAAFEASLTLTATATVMGVAVASVTLSTHQRPDAMGLETYQVGIALPLSPTWDGTVAPQEFDAPVYVNSGVATIGSYDIHVQFNPNQLEVLSVSGAGDGTVFPDPVGNAGPISNSTGTLMFNGINTAPPWESEMMALAKGPKVHFATIKFRTKAGLYSGVVSPITGNIQYLGSTDLVPLEADTGSAVLFHGGSGMTENGEISAQSVGLSGLFVTNPASLLLAWYPLTGTNDSAQLDVTGLRGDGELVDVSTDTETSYNVSDAALLSVTTDGAIEAQPAENSDNDWVDITVTHADHSTNTSVRVLVLKDFQIHVTDDELQAIANHPAGASQSAKLTVTGQWFAGNTPITTMDVTTMTSVIPSPGLIYKSILREFSGNGDGLHTFDVRGATGNTLTSGTITVDSLSPVEILSLSVIAPCYAYNVSMLPSTIVPDEGIATMTVGVNALLDEIAATCQAQVFGQLDDGTSMRLTGDPVISFSTDEAGIIESTGTGKLTAIGMGETTIHATIMDGDSVILTGERTVTVGL